MSNYYNMKDAKVRISHELMNHGWKVYGYKADESDSMTDYYSPANWNGIATKNGFILVVDEPYGNYIGHEITKYNPAGNLSIEDRNKITKLEEMTQENGTTAGEEENAKLLIEKIQSRIQGKSAYEVIDKYPVYMPNPSKHTKWHIEKDGKIFDKGNGITKYADVPNEWEFDINTMQYKKGYDYWMEWEDGERIKKPKTLTKEESKVINDFKNLILRFERVVNNMNTCGDGTAETEREGMEQQQKEGYEKIIEKVTKKSLKMVEVNKNYIEVGDYLTLAHHGHYWKVINEHMQKGTWKGIQEERKAFTYEIVGAASRGYKSLKNAKGYYNYEFKMLKDIEAGKIKIYELKEVEEVQEVEKWVKINQTKTVKQNTKINEQKQQTRENNNIINYEYTITADVDTRDNSPLWVVKIIDKLDKEEYKKVASQFKQLKGYYSKFKHGFIFKYDPTETLKGNNRTEQEQPTESKGKEIANAITDYSTKIITELSLKPNEYLNNEQYKTILAEKLQEKNIKITAEILNNIEIEGLKQVLELIQNELELKQKQATQQKEKNNLLEKINKNINSLRSKIDNLSGDYKVNTYKRMREQEGRDSKINSWKLDINILEYVKEKLIDNQSITAFERGLLTGTFRIEIHSYYNQKYGRCPREIEFPKIKYDIPLDGWYNKEVPKMQKKLQKYNITNTKELNTAIDEYRLIYNSVSKYISPKEQQIKKLTNEYKLQQKGDINFTPVEVVEQMIKFAKINNNSQVLEPSAGIGNIADKIKEVTEHIDVIEYNYNFAELLQLKDYNLVANDFLEYNKKNYYDTIIMNPPFSNNQDIIHLKHAYNLLKPNGTLVCITSPHWTYANDKTSQNFKEWINNKDYFTQELPSGTFEMTGVRSQIIIIEKEEEILQQVI